ncbi:protein FAM160B2 [Austrofundulus limnaeus]|uniref:Protein FAM160B2 n=1 Tax=Austrofundulus limnaeus TaxID=52670 RepID=A0A2I4CUC9_AUSLI|nr:PREDICTED: protein FAM160B2-like [Austrofundulus limnaeus]
METFSKLGSLLLRALETREPTVELLESFIDHWKSITNYYIQTTDDNRPVSQTDIPWRLRQMLDILVYEEKQQAVEDTGPCLEYLLQHKLLETLCTLGKAQYPPGMSQQVLLFFFKLLSQMQKPLLQLVGVYRPVQKLIGLCALPGSCTEKEEAQFLSAVCSQVKQDPHALRYILQVTERPPASCTDTTNHNTDPSCNQSEASACSPVQSESGLFWALLQLTKSHRASVSHRACESLLVLSGLLDGSSEELLPAGTPLGELLARRLQELHLLLPLEELDATELRSWPPTPWRSESEPGHVTSFFTWFDFLDHLTRESPQVLGVHVSQCVRQLWLVDALHPQLLHTCLCSGLSRWFLASTSLLCAAVRLVQSPSLLDQMVHFLLRTPSLMELLLQRCDHISDQISMTSLSLVDELLQKPHEDILDVLVLSFLRGRRYLSSPAGGQEDRQPESGEDSEDSQDLEEDPFFSDSLSDGAPPPPPPPQSSSAGVVNSFLCLVPVQVRSAHLLQEGGYESYVHDARTLVSQCQALSQSWNWQQAPPPPACPSGEDAVFFEGHLLKVLFDRLGRILEQPYELNLQLTAILSRLSAFSHALLDEYLLDPYIHLSHCCRSLFSVLVRVRQVMAELMQRIQEVSNVSEKLLDTRRNLIGLNSHTGLEHLTLLKAVIVLEEFCKELAAIAFVKLPLDQD